MDNEANHEIDESSFDQSASFGDWGLVLLRAGISAVPVIGGPVAVLLEEIPTSRKRKFTNFINNFLIPTLQRNEGAFKDNEAKFNEYLKKDEVNEVFIDLFTRMQNESREEKLRAYSNFFAKASIELNEDTDELREFLRIIDWLSVRQLLILGLIGNILNDAAFQMSVLKQWQNSRPISFYTASNKYASDHGLRSPAPMPEDKGLFEFFGLFNKTTDYTNWWETRTVVKDFSSLFEFPELSGKGQKFIEYISSAT